MAQSVELQMARDHDEQDSEKPLKIGGQARTTNPTAVGNADKVNFISDDLGKQIVNLFVVRDLIATARAETATLAEVSLLAGGGAGVFHDLVQITCANTCGAAVTLSIRDNLAGGVVETVQLGANETRELSFTVPKPQNEAANAWTIQNAGSGDTSTTAIAVSATFIKNV
mgnify:CR=1 FL=1